MLRAALLGALLSFAGLGLPAMAQDSGEIAFWNSVADSGSIAKLQLYLDTYPNGHFVQLAKLTIEELGGQASSSTPEKAPSFADAVKKERKKRAEAEKEKRKKKRKKAKRTKSSGSNSSQSAQGNDLERLFIPEIRVEEKSESGFTLAKIFGEREQTAAEKRCDALAGHTSDKTLPVAPTPFPKLKEHATQAISICLEAIKQGEARQYYQLYRAYTAMGKHDVARKYLISAAEDGHHMARYWLAHRYLYGSSGEKKNLSKGLELMVANCREGDGVSMAQLGSIAYWGLKSNKSIIRKNKARAHQLYQLAELRGASGVYFHLGDMYKRGDYLKKNLKKARHYYELSIKTKASNRASARKALASLARDSYWWLKRYKDIAPEISNMWAHLDNLQDQVGSSVESHNKLISALVDHINWLINVKSSTMGWDFYGASASETARKQARQRTSQWMDHLIARLQSATNRRYSAFYGRFDGHAPQDVAKQAARYYTINAKIDEQLGQYFRVMDIRNETDRSAPQACDVQKNKWRKGVFVVTFLNACRETITIKGTVKIKYKGGRYSTQKDSYSFNLKPGKSRKVTLRRNRNATASGAVSYQTCYSSDKIKDTSEGKFTCEAGVHTKSTINHWKKDLDGLSRYFNKKPA